MRKIANTAELQTELRRLLSYTQSEQPSRARVANDLQKLSKRLVGTTEEDRNTSYSDQELSAALRKVVTQVTKAQAAGERGNAGEMFSSLAMALDWVAELSDAYEISGAAHSLMQAAKALKAGS
jgi:hypothetical protein